MAFDLVKIGQLVPVEVINKFSQFIAIFSHLVSEPLISHLKSSFTRYFDKSINKFLALLLPLSQLA